MDTSGNVGEWCLNPPHAPNNRDEWDSTDISEEFIAHKPDVLDPNGHRERSWRGGCWYFDQTRADVHCRDYYRPDNLAVSLGFHLIVSELAGRNTITIDASHNQLRARGEYWIPLRSLPPPPSRRVYQRFTSARLLALNDVNP
jgi:hypothetical protein